MPQSLYYRAAKLCLLLPHGQSYGTGRRLGFLLLAFGLIVLRGEALEAQPPMTMGVSARSALNGVTLQIVGGRILASTNVTYTSRRSITTGMGSTREEVALALAQGTVTVDYKRTEPQRVLTFHASPNQSARIEIQPQGAAAGPSLVYHQDAAGAVEFLWKKDDVQRTLKTVGLWPLLIREPAICREALVPFLELLRPEWKLSAAIDQMTEQLCRLGEADSSPQRDRWAWLVRQLAHEKYAKRQAADLELRSVGEGLRGFLVSLDNDQLDAEQRYRIRGIVTSLVRGNQDDLPERVAIWLMEDREVWFALLAHQDLAKRQAACKRLSSLLERPIEFDPEADVATREAQRERIAQLLATQSPGGGSNAPTNGTNRQPER